MSRASATASVSSRRPPLVPCVVRDPGPRELSESVDWTSWYLTDEEDMGESPEQGEIIRLLLSVLGQLAHLRAWTGVYIGADNFFAWRADEPLVRISPDVYLLRDPPPPPLPASWQTWRSGHHAPDLAIEIVSEDWKKDYEQAPEKYAQLGVKELVIFDPAAAAGEVHPEDRVPLQLYRRTVDGLFVRRAAGPGPVLSLCLDAWLLAGGSDQPRLRVSLDERGDDLVPTADEARQIAERRLLAEREARLAAEEALAALRARG